MKNRRPFAVIGVALVVLLIGLMLVGCASVRPRETRMCSVEEVEMEVSKGRKYFEVDFTNGKEQAISEVQYNIWKRDLPKQLPCP